MAPPDELRTRETGDEHLPGYAELAPVNPDPDTLSRVLQQRAAELGLPAVAGRGVPRALRPLVDILHKRRLVDDLGTYDATVTWLELHAPRGGSGALKVAHRRNRAGGVFPGTARASRPPIRPATPHERINDCG